MQHTVLIGFKNVGKTSIGQSLAELNELPFIDLDQAIEKEYELRNGNNLSVRQIVIKEGLENFRKLESEVLRSVLAAKEKTIISLGGGTPLNLDNHTLINEHFVVNITADKSNVYERIMINGRPAFFPDDEDPYMAFRRLWDERNDVYDNLAQITISNNGSLDKAISELQRIIFN